MSNQKMEILAQQGEGRYLISLGNDQGQILDLNENALYPPIFIHSILARGYWEDYDGNVDLDYVLRTVRIIR